LPAGVTAVSGRFERGDTVSVLDLDGQEIARGMVAYNDRDATRLIGKRSADIETLLGFRGRAEMIHRDDLVMMRSEFAQA
jgi:glutamate 5-kinase